MSWRVAMAWLGVLALDNTFLGVWRAQRGPGPWSIFFAHERGLLEVWAAPGPQLYGKLMPMPSIPEE